MKTQKLEAIVLKRFNFSDADRFITLFSLEQGKILVLAKGIRKMSSKKRPSLEPVNYVKLLIAKTKSTHIVTQSELQNSFPDLKKNLTKITQTYQLLEIIDALLPEEVPHPTIFHTLLATFDHLKTQQENKSYLLETISFIIQDLGFGLPTNLSETNLKNHLESITQTPLKSKKFFSTYLK